MKSINHIPKISTNIKFQQEAGRKIRLRHNLIKFLKASDKEKILRAARGKKDMLQTEEQR